MLVVQKVLSRGEVSWQSVDVEQGFSLNTESTEQYEGETIRGHKTNDIYDHNRVPLSKPSCLVIPESFRYIYIAIHKFIYISNT